MNGRLFSRCVVLPQIARLISRLVKTRNYDVDPKVLKTFLALRIKQVNRPEDAMNEQRRVKREKRKIMSRRDKKVRYRSKMYCSQLPPPRPFCIFVSAKHFTLSNVNMLVEI